MTSTLSLASRDTQAYPVADWAAWHAARERDLVDPHGWLSLTGFQWLDPTPVAVQGLPGLWSADDDHATLSISVDDDVSVLDGDTVAGVLTARVEEQGSLRWVQVGDRQVELARRGGRYAIRIRDPRAVTRTGFTGVPTFPLNADWVLTGVVTERPEAQQVEVGTAREDLRQSVSIVGDLDLTLPDHSSVSLAVGRAGDGGYTLAFRDATNGSQTAPWRTVTTSAPDVDGRVSVDFNRAVNYPFAFTAYGTCPAPVDGNFLEIAVTAGELAPRVIVES